MQHTENLLPDEQDNKEVPEVITFTGGINLQAPGAGING